MLVAIIQTYDGGGKFWGVVTGEDKISGGYKVDVDHIDGRSPLAATIEEYKAMPHDYLDPITWRAITDPVPVQVLSNRRL